MGLSIGLIPSLAIGASAFGAGELILQNIKKENSKEKARNIYEILSESKSINDGIKKMIPKIEDEKVVKNINEIYESINKIISAVEKNPGKYKKMNNFFNYYLPVTMNILKKYDEIENQRLTTVDSNKFMKSTQEMISKINDAYKKQLSNLYQSDMIDTDAEMKVFESMLESDGFYGNDDFEVK